MHNLYMYNIKEGTVKEQLYKLNTLAFVLYCDAIML